MVASVEGVPFREADLAADHLVLGVRVLPTMSMRSM